MPTMRSRELKQKKADGMTRVARRQSTKSSLRNRRKGRANRR